VLRTLREFYKKRSVLQEAELDVSSLDAQIDRYLSGYERSSQKNKEESPPQVAETQSLRSFFISVLNEAETDDLISKLKTKPNDEDKPEDEPEEEMPEPVEPIEEPVDEPAAEEPPPTGAQPTTEPEELGDTEGGLDFGGEENTTEDDGIAPRPGGLDLSTFANSVDNLVKNHGNLLDMKSVIVSRAVELVKANYGEEDAKEFEQMLANNFKLQSADKNDKPY